MPAFCLLALYLLAGEAAGRTVYQNTPAFPLSVKRVKGDDIADVLLEYYDERLSRWLGYGLFSVSRELDGALRARIAFRAPYEGVFRLRSIARDRAGNVEEASADPTAYEALAVYDATAPVVEMIFPRGGETVEVPGVVRIRWLAHDAHLASQQAVRVLLSTDAGISFKPLAAWSDRAEEFEYDAPDVTSRRAVVAVEVKDLAGNVGRAESGVFTLLGSRQIEPPPGRPPAVAPVQRYERPAEPRAAGVGETAARALAKRYYTRGVIYLVRGDYDEAQRELAAALQADPDYMPARIDLGVALAEMGRTNEAIEFLENSLKSFPAEPDLALNAAMLYQRTGDLAQALGNFKRVLALDPDRLDAMWLAAECAAQLGQLTAAANWWLRIVQITTPANRYHARALAYLQKSGIDIERIMPPATGRPISTPAPVTEPPGMPPQPLPDSLLKPPGRLKPPAPQLPPHETFQSAPAATGAAWR